MPRKTGRRRHVPQRTCVGCRQILPKRSLVRIVRSAQGVVIDPTGKLAGRGAYLHDLQACWKNGLNGNLESALRTTLTPEEREHFINYSSSLPDSDPIMIE